MYDPASNPKAICNYSIVLESMKLTRFYIMYYHFKYCEKCDSAKLKLAYNSQQ